jgi:Pvc16 N-terminal domain/Carboxypeptidase regulatory-like domain
VSPVDVPLNTAIADLDDALRTLLRRELGRHGFEGVAISFDAPSKEWSGKLTGPTVDLFLYDLREAPGRATNTPSQRHGNGRALTVMPPLQLELTYAVSAWTTAVEDEHRLLSQVLAILFSHRKIPRDVLRSDTDPVLSTADTLVGRPREEKADFWSAVGGQYKASIDYVVHITVESGAAVVRGPEVRTRTILVRDSDAPASTMQATHGFGGTLRDAEGEPLANAWIVIPELGRWASTGSDGRFRFARIAAGTYHLLVRTLDGRQTEATATVPGRGTDIVVGRARQSRVKAAKKDQSP